MIAVSSRRRRACSPLIFNVGIWRLPGTHALELSTNGDVLVVTPVRDRVEYSDVATVRRDTHPGTVLGTAGCMSPEQVRGESVDHRSDIFSFGAILYEMLSGQRAFKRDSSPARNAAAGRHQRRRPAAGP
jgi:serine/threonine protein kinase